LLLWSTWQLSDNLSAWLISAYPWDWGRETLASIFQVLGFALTLMLGLMVFKNLVSVLSSPFMSLLSEKIEHHLAGLPSHSGLSLSRALTEMARGLALAIRNLLWELSLLLVLFLLSLIPILSPFTLALAFLVGSYYAGFSAMDYTLERHLGVRKSLQFMKRNRALVLGNGTVYLLILLSGIGFLFALPLATAAAVPEVLKRISK